MFALHHTTDSLSTQAGSTRQAQGGTRQAMSALLYTSPRSSPSPAGEPFHHPHSTMARHQVAFGQSAHQQAPGTSGSLFGGSTVSSSSSSHAGPSHQSSAAPPAAAAGASSFGFGFASSGSMSASTSTSTSKYAPSTSTSPFKLPSNAYITTMAATSPQASSNRRRRRRSDSPDGREMEEHREDEGDSLLNGLDTATAYGKRARREIRPVKSMLALGSQAHQAPPASSAQNTQTTAPRDEFDVGKALASLSKPALLSVLTSLLATQPSLKPVVLSLLPAPSLESFTSTLHAAEKKVLDALPVGRNLRDEYIWSRIRAPLEEYVAEARLALSQFCPPSSSTTHPSSEHDAQSSQQQQQHPATIFSFLFTLTQSVRKLEVTLPRAPLPFGSSRMNSSSNSQQQQQASINNPSSLNQNDPLVCFLPALFNQWHVLVTKLSNLVNQHGRVLSAEMIRTWFKQLDALVEMSGTHPTTASAVSNDSDSTSVGRKACEAVRERFIKELGWLIGIRTPVAFTSSPHQQAHQQGQGGIQAVANQFMDSRMMMADNEESDEEL